MFSKIQNGFANMAKTFQISCYSCTSCVNLNIKMELTYEPVCKLLYFFYYCNVAFI